MYKHVFSPIKVYFKFHPGMYQSNLGHSMIPHAAPMQYLPQMNPNYMPQQVLHTKYIERPTLSKSVRYLKYRIFKIIQGNVLESNTS